MKTTLHPGLTARLDYVVPAERTGPHLLPEAAEFAALPDVLATGYLVGIIEWACMRAVNEHRGSQRSDTYLHEVGTL